jgi:hypothetical protein
VCKCFGVTVTDENYIYEQTNSRINYGNFHFRSDSLTCVLWKLSVLIYRCMSVFMYDCETWSFALMELYVGWRCARTGVLRECLY